ILAAARPCARQDLADEVITTVKTNPDFKDETLRKALIEWAKVLCGAEKNTHPIYANSPQTPRNFLYCLKKPVNEELDGIIPVQDPANGPELFFDPKAPGGTVKLDQVPETRPRGFSKSGKNSTGSQIKTNLSETTNQDLTVANITISNITTTPTKSAGSIDLSKLPECDDPSIEFGGGMKNRKATDYTYATRNQKQFPHGEAQNLQIITRAICDIILHCVKKANNDKDEDEQGTVRKCREMSEKLGVKKKDGKAADEWNLKVRSSS
ncbi:hypothetical protein CROQUDRAFT_27094, partial [Cronartium quercuum f. sp. fusiforme G11]